MNWLQLAISVLGGLALFIYGMGLMSDGLVQIAGARMKSVLGYVTKNRVAAIAAGAGVTALIQSSSATTVMTVGFVNAGLLSLQQAIGVIFGANIGTTITGQLVALKLSDLALPAVILGVVGLMVAKRARSRGLWRTLLGFGLLFFGMNMMGHELKAVAKLQEFVSFFSTFDCSPSASGFLPLGSVLGAIAVGTLCTMLVQSSSATIGITIALAEAGLINFWTAVPIILGDNIGTTITAALASIGTNANAKRTALAHALFNLIGTVLLVSTFVFVFDKGGVRAPAFFHLVNWAASGDGFAGVNPGRHVAMAHTLFNVTNVLVLAFFIPLLAKLCERILRANRNDSILTLEPHLLGAPELALHAAIRAMGDMTRRAWVVASAALHNCLGRATVDQESIENAEKEIDEMQREIRNYLVQVSQRKLDTRQAQMIPEIIHCVNDAERVGDLALKVYRKTEKVKGAEMDEALRTEVRSAVSDVRALANETVESIRKGEDVSIKAYKLKSKVYLSAKSAARSAPMNLPIHSIFSSLKDIARHLDNIAARVPSFA